MLVKSQNPLFGEVHNTQDLILLRKISVSRHRRGLEKCDFNNYPESNLPGIYSACPAHGESQLPRFQLLDWPINYPESNLPGMFCLISTMLVFQKSAYFERKNPNAFSATRLLRCVFVINFDA